MWSWAKIIYTVVSVFREISIFIETQKAIAQGRRDQELANRRAEDARISSAARARDDIVTDGVQPIDIKTITDKDPNNRDNWK